MLTNDQRHHRDLVDQWTPSNPSLASLDPRRTFTTHVICDTLYLSWQSPPTGWIQEAAAKAGARRGSLWGWGPLPGGRLGVREFDPSECAPWSVKAASLDGFATAYGTLVQGHGPWQDVRLMLGIQRPQDDQQKPSYRLMLMIGSSRLWAWACGGAMWKDYARDAFSCGRAIIELLALDAPDSPALIPMVPPPEVVKVRRFDACVDHWHLGDWTLKDRDQFASKTKTRGLMWRDVRDGKMSKAWGITDLSEFRGSETTTLYVGKRGMRMMRCYNKLVEARVSGKSAWMHPIWAQAGWDGPPRIEGGQRRGSIVWRVEFEHSGQWMTDHGAATMDKLPGIERLLWEEAVEAVRHVEPSFKRLRLCRTSDRWQVLQEAGARQVWPVGWSSTESPWQWQPKPATDCQDQERLWAMSMGCLRKVVRNQVRGPASMTLGAAPGSFAPPCPAEQVAALDAMLARIREEVLKGG